MWKLIRANKEIFIILTGLLTIMPSCCIAAIKENPDKRTFLENTCTKICFDFGWRFFKGDFSDAYKVRYDDCGWRELNVPHDWSIEGPFDVNNPAGIQGAYLPGGIGWYRKHFRLPEKYKGKKVFIQFDGIYHNSEVWINSHYLGKRPYGYISFLYDLTDYLKFNGENILAVRVDNSDQPNCRWYSGSGIYRHVWLKITDKLHVSHWGTYITTPEVSEKSATIRIRTKVKNEYQSSKKCGLTMTIVDKRGRTIAETKSSHSVPADSEYEFDQILKINNPILWSVENPQLYVSRSVVSDSKNILDEYKTPFGIRKFRFDKDKGFFLNGKNIKFKGVCIHHDAGCLGAAVPDRALERRLEVLKSLGCNAIRTSHNPPAPELLDMCDMMGFLVIDEAFDKWSGASFAKWWKDDLRAMLRRDRNHPCVILWSVGNEVGNQGSPEANRTLEMLVEFVHKEEPTRPVTCALRPSIFKTRQKNAEHITDIAKLMDVTSLNYQEQAYADCKKVWPEIIIIGTECYPYFRGKAARYKAYEASNPWFDVVRNDYVVGQFLWTGIDYLGESRGWPDKGWSTALIDTCGFRKPRSYFHQSVWSDEPMVHIAVFDNSLDINPGKLHWGWPKIASHWTFPNFKNQVLRLITYTNCQSVELWIGEYLWGEKFLSEFDDRMMIWYFPYRPETLKAIGKNNGQEVCSYELRTSGKPAKIVLKPDRTTITANGQDLSHIEVNVTDTNDILVPTAKHLINFHIEGEGKIIGVDNGDLRSGESYKKNKRSAFMGRCLVIIQSTAKPGVVRLAAYAEGLETAEITLDTIKSQKRQIF